MLPLMMLQPTDLATFTPEPNSAELLPPDALDPAVAFADVLQVGLQPLVQPAGSDGTPMPAGGNGLPPALAPEAGTAGPVPGRTLPMPDVELLAVEVRSAPGLVAAQATLSAEGRLPALPTGVSPEPAARIPATLEPTQAPAGQRVPADNLFHQATGARVALDGEPASPVPATRPQSAPEPTVPRALHEAAVASAPTNASAELAESTLGRRQRPGTMPEGLPFRAGHPDAPPAALARTDDLRASVAPELRQPAPVVPAGQPTQFSLDGLNQTELQPGQGPGTAQSLQATPAQLSQTPLQATSTATTAAAPQAQASIDVPVRDTAWSSMLGERVVVMANNQLQNAEIRLTPAELGPLRVQVAIEDGAANVTFHAQHAVTREAIEQALPRLRELFAENGLTLNQADVGEQAGPGVQQGNREAAGDGAMGDGVSAQTDEERAAEAVLATERPRSRAEGLVDTFV